MLFWWSSGSTVALVAHRCLLAVERRDVDAPLGQDTALHLLGQLFRQLNCKRGVDLGFASAMRHLLAGHVGLDRAVVVEVLLSIETVLVHLLVFNTSSGLTVGLTNL